MSTTDETLITGSIIETATIREQVTDIIRHKILSGEFKGDMQISERMISNQLNISTTPVKEAFRILQTEGIIYTVPRKGTFVSKFSRHYMEQATFIRGALEGVAAYFAAQNITDKEIGRLEGLLEQSRQIIFDSPENFESNLEDLIDTNQDFHSILRSASKNEYLIQQIKMLRSLDRAFREVALSKENEERKRAYGEHLSILNAIKAHDPVLAEQRMNFHIRRVADFVFSEN